MTEYKSALSFAKKFVSVILTYFFHTEFDIVNNLTVKLPFVSELEKYLSSEIIDNILGFLNVIFVFIAAYLVTSLVFILFKTSKKEGKIENDY